MSLFSCKDMAYLLSKALDQDLRFRERWTLRLHLVLCPICVRFRRYLLFLRRAARRLDETADRDSDDNKLSIAARARQQRGLEDQRPPE